MTVYQNIVFVEFILIFDGVEIFLMKVLVTGASGRLGSNLCRLLLAENVNFLAVDKVSDPDASYPVGLADLRDLDQCKDLFNGVGVIAHFANHASFDRGSVEEVYNDNVTMNMNLFQSAANAGCKRIIFSSSIQVFDGQLPVRDRAIQENVLPYLPMDSEMPPCPRNSYALSKLAAENALSYFSDTTGITAIVFRFPLLVDATMMKDALAQGGMLRGNAYDGFAYLPVYSAAEAVVKAMSAKVAGCKKYFVASKDNLEQRPAREIIDEEMPNLALNLPIERIDSLVDCSRVETELGWQQPNSMAESVERFGGLQGVRSYE